MFGYVKAYKPEMKVCEYDTYKAVYCTLCKRLGKQYGVFARMTLSYDFTFLALLQLAMSEECPGFTQKHCVYNPFKKCNFCKAGDKEFDFTCATAVIMLYHKICDNIHDSGAFKSLLYRIARIFIASPYKKAAKKYPQVKDIVSSMMENQLIVESGQNVGIDCAAEPTALSLGKIMELCSDDEKQKKVLYRLGYCIGKWIYLMDAVCDIEDDIKSGNFNPIKNHDKDSAVATMNVCSNEAGKALELLNINRYKNILYNIIYIGLINEAKRVQIKEKERQDEAK